MNRFGTFGVLLEDGSPFALTLEPQWYLNAQDLSCIPPAPGEDQYYVCSRVESPKFGRTYEVLNVPGRGNILFHWGNRLRDTLGCIIIGEEFGVLSDELAVLSSKRGFDEFIKRTDGYETFPLRISWYSQ